MNLLPTTKNLTNKNLSNFSKNTQHATSLDNQEKQIHLSQEEIA